MKKFFTLGVALCCCLSAFAEPVSESEARKTALSLLKSELGSTQLKSGKKLTSNALKLVKAEKYGTIPLYYVYNAENDGFVIVSGVEETAPILAYGLEKGIDMDNMSEATKIFLKSYAATLKKIAANPSSYTTKAETKEDIAVMIETEWNQGAPYSDLTKFKSQNADTVVPCYTGCPATAMTMLMKYYYDNKGWFTSTKEEIPGYNVAYKVKNITIDSIVVDALPVKEFDWANCLDKYEPGTYDEEDANAVAEVMRYCGQAQKMEYDPKGSGAFDYDNVNGINKYFIGSNADFQGVLFSKKMYSDEEWWDILYNELKNGRPVNMSGYGGTGDGHTFIADGYQQRNDADYYHFNWGWGGMADGYFRYDSIFAKNTVGGTDVIDLTNFNNIITFLTDDELKEYEENYNIADYFVGPGANIGVDSIDNITYKMPLTYSKNNEEVNNQIKIKIFYAPLGTRSVLEPYVAVFSLNDENAKPLYIAAAGKDTEGNDITYNPNDTSSIIFVVTAAELKKAMTDAGLSTGENDVYYLWPKLSGDKDVDDYVDRYIQYFFKFSADDTLQLIPQVKFDKLFFDGYGLNGMKAYYNVPEELQGHSYYIASRFSIDSNPIEIDEKFIAEDAVDGYFEVKSIAEELVTSYPGYHKYTVELANGIISFTQTLISMGYTKSAIQRGEELFDANGKLLEENTTLNNDDSFIFKDWIVGIPSYNEGDGTWGYGSSPMLGKVVLDANDDNSGLFKFQSKSKIPSDSTIQLLNEGKTTQANEVYLTPMDVKDVLGGIEKYESLYDASDIYRFVTTVDTGFVYMPTNGLYFANYFRANSDYSKLEFISPVKIAGENANITIKDASAVTVTLKPIEGVLKPRADVYIVIYYNETDTETYWFGSGADRISGETNISLTGTSRHNLEEGQTYYYKLLNHDGILIAQGSFNATGINEINAESDNSGSTSAKYNGKKYNLAGQEVDSNYKGIVILNGAKHVQK